MAAKKDLKYFMRNNEPEIVTVPGLESIKDENGNVIPFEIKVLPKAEIDKIYENYERKEIATDKRGNPLVSNGQVALKVSKNYDKVEHHLIVEALQYPNLKDPELMEFYHCVNKIEMPLHVFSRADEYAYVSKIVFSTLGLIEASADSDEELEEAKN